VRSCVDDEVLHRFATGTASRRECREVVRHLLARCGTCAGRLRSVVQPPIEEGVYDDALARMNAMARGLPPAGSDRRPGPHRVSPW